MIKHQQTAIALVAYTIMGACIAHLNIAKSDATELATGMQGLSLSFRRLEESVSQNRYQEALEVAEELGSKSAALRTGYPSPHTSGTVGQRHLNQIQELSRLLRESAQSSKRREVAHRIEQIRHNCVSCHIHSRDTDTLAASYPAKGNTLVVDVKLTTVDGQPKSNHSNVVVFLDGIPRQTFMPVESPSVSQQNRGFSPRVLPIVRGTTVQFPNDDTILHNVFSISKARKFDLDVYRPGKAKSVTFPKPGLVKLYCNIHPEMSCSILILNNPLFALTDATGRCVITGVPDGSVTLRTWHEYGGETRQRLTLGDEPVVQLDLKVVEKRRSIAHTNKYGQPYGKPRTKY
jgi:hypothetical protein